VTTLVAVKLTQNRSNDLCIDVMVLALEQLVFPTRYHIRDRLGCLGKKEISTPGGMSTSPESQYRHGGDRDELPDCITHRAAPSVQTDL
jgi:hypothetical protein